MAKTSRPYKLSPMIGGTNTNVSDASDDQTVYAENVVNDEDGLRRRPSFSAFQISGRFDLPRAQTHLVVANYTSDTLTLDMTKGNVVVALTASTQLLSLYGASTSSNRRRIFIGCDTQFQGVELFNAIQTYNAATEAFFLRVRFVIADITSITSPSADVSKLSDCKWFMDTTGYVADSAASFRSPLHVPGYVAWHKNSQPTEWDTKRTVGVTSAYWIVIDLSSTPQDFNTTGTGLDYASSYVNTSTWRLEQPYLTCFTLQPVTTIAPLTSKDRNSFIVTSSRDSAYGQETGPQLTLIPSDGHTSNRDILLVKDYGSCFVGTYAGPSVWTTSISLTHTEQIRKIDESYDWTPSVVSGSVNVFWGQWGFPILATGISPTSSTTTSMVFTLQGSYDTEFNDCLFYCTVSGTSGPTVARYNRVRETTVSGSTVTVTFAWAFNNAPPTDSDFTILGIPHKLEIFSEESVSATVGNDTDLIFDIVENDASGNSALSTRAYYPTTLSSLPDRKTLSYRVTSMGLFNIGREPRYELSNNPYTSFTFDTVTRRFIFAMGDYPMQRWDGTRFVELTCLSDPEDKVVEQFRGFEAKRTAGEQSDSSEPLVAGTLRTTPPRGKFVTCFGSRIFVSGVSGADNLVFYSAASGYNDIWPKQNEASIRNPEGDPITGMAVLNDELVVFTASSIFSAPAPDDLGFVSFTPRAQGIGFINNNSVQKITKNSASWLLGANNDGIYSFNGSEPVSVLQRWSDVIPEGVNQSTLYRCCAAVNFSETCYYLAVPSAFSEYPDKLIRYDYSDGTMYVWSAPFGGITAIARDYDADGNEEIIFGHADGTLSRLSDNVKDDGESIASYARTKPFTAGGLTLGVTGYMVTMAHASDVTIKEILNEDESDVNTLYSGAFDTGYDAVGTFLLGTDTLASDKKLTKKINSKAGTRAQSVQLEISSTSSKWKVRNIEVLQRPLGQRSK